MISIFKIIGIGEEGFAALSPQAYEHAEKAEVFLGGKRHLAMIPSSFSAEKIEWTKPFCKNFDIVDSFKGKNLCILASGDPMHYGIGATLVQRYGADRFLIFPSPSAFSLATAKLGWKRDTVTTVSLHGRDVNALTVLLQPARKILALTSDGEAIERIAQHLCQKGFGESAFYVLEHLGSKEKEKIHFFPSARLVFSKKRFAPLNLVAIECQTMDRWYSPLSSLPDDAFIHDGQMTKMNIRAMSLSKLNPHPEALLWDIGGGSGSISIEWMRMGGRCIIIEKNKKRCEMINQNAKNFGVSNFDLHEEEACSVLKNLDPAPDSIFIGGGLTPAIFELCAHLLKKGGRLVANTVTVESEAILLMQQEKQGGEIYRIALSRLEKIGPYRGFKALMPVTQYCWEKP